MAKQLKQKIIEKDIIERNYINGYSEGVKFATKEVSSLAVNVAKDFIHPKLLITFKNKLKKELYLL